MPKLIVNGLTPMKVKREKRPGYYADGNNLYLLVAKNGQGYFVWRGKVQDRKWRSEIGIGPVRQVSLAEAREIARQWCQIAKAGDDPKAERDKGRRTSLTFEQAARKVHADQIKPHNRNPKHVKQWLTTLQTYAFPTIGARPVHGLTQADVLRVLAPIWTEKPETARRVRQRLRTVMDWAKTAGHYEGENPINGVEKGLPKQRGKVQHFRALPYVELPEVMRRIEGVEGVGALALRFAILTATRSGEVRGATWAEIDTEARVWRIPPERMKAGEEHKVPLSGAALAVLEAVKGLDPVLVFPSRRQGRPLSDMTLAAVLKRLKMDATVHGMRSTFRDWCEENTRYSREIKERALANTVRDKVEAAYRRGDLFEQRRALMDDWGRFCTAEAGKVVELRA